MKVTIQPISSTDGHSASTEATHSKPPAPKSPEPMPQDSVQLSSHAKAAVDKDHDGDSH
jgi:hypothetical protein